MPNFNFRTDDCPDTGCYCDWITFPPCPFCIMKSSWDNISPMDRAFLISYKKVLLEDRKVTEAMMDKINELHEKYPDFCMADVP